jgi:Holliday junction resolvase RusA-like endonuclease
LEVIYGNTPSKSNCYKIIQKRLKGGKTQSSLGKTPALTRYENAFYMQLSGKLRGVMYKGYFELHVDVYYPSGRADLDNSLKIILDCLQKTKTIPNDNKCSKIVARRFIDKKEPRIEFKIETVDEQN